LGVQALEDSDVALAADVGAWPASLGPDDEPTSVTASIPIQIADPLFIEDLASAINPMVLA
jgi:hypothetical protein